MGETVFYLIRHAEAEGNLYRRIHGHYDSDLTKNGLRQVEALRRRFSGVRLDAVYSSDLVRTIKTARAVADGKGLEIRTDPRLREIGVGAWEDHPFGELFHFYPKEMERFNHAPEKWRSPEGAENYRSATKRFLSALRSIADEHPDSAVAVVTHGTVLNWTVYSLFPDAANVHSDNTAVTRLRFDGSWRLDYLSDNSHVSPEISTLGKQRWWRNDGTRDQNIWIQPYEDQIDWYLELCDDTVPVSTMAVIFFAMLEDRPVGLLQLDPLRDSREGVGVIDDLHVIESLRRQTFGTQTLGEAVSYYRAQGRHTLRIYLPEEKRAAIPFLTAVGFSERVNGIFEKSIQVSL